MNSDNDVPAIIDASHYAKGEIAGRLRGLATARSQGNSPMDARDAFRRAAAVFVAINPATLSVGSAEGLPTAFPSELLPSPYADLVSEYPMTLSASARKSALRQLHSSAAMQEALDRQQVWPDNLMQRTFVRAIRGEQFKFEDLDSGELATLASVSDWLQGTEPGNRLPDPFIVRAEIERRREQDTLIRLVGAHFTGRHAELKRIRDFFESRAMKVLVVSGPGGVGKSALISRALLAWTGEASPPVKHQTRRTWIRIDLDHSLVEPDRPVTVMREAALQLARRFPEFSSLLRDFVGLSQDSAVLRSSADFESQGPLSTPKDVVAEFIQVLGYTCAGEGQSLVLWIDTFEEAQFLGAAAVNELLVFVRDIASAVRSVKIVLSGRTPIDSPFFKETTSDAISLLDLELASARSLLSDLVRHANPDVSGVEHIVDKVARSVGGNPLTLHLAAPLIVGGDSLALPTRVSRQALQQWLYSRILTHIHDETVREIAKYSLVLRKVTAGIIKEVLAAPCGLGSVDDIRASELLGSFAKELTLVQRESDGSLRHRVDLRAVMLRALPAEVKAATKSIDLAAAAYWSRRPEPAARAEEIYHRLRLGESSVVLSERWMPGAAPFLRSALNEFPRRSTRRAWLASKLGASLDEPEIEQVSQREWEEQAAMEAQRYLAQGEPQLAINELLRRRRRAPGSRLFALESRAHLLLGAEAKALSLAWAGIEASRESWKEVAADLAMLVGFIEERARNFELATEAVTLACALADKTSDEMLQLASSLRLLRIQRVSGSTVDLRLAAGSCKQADRIGPSALSRKSSVLRELAAELGGFRPEYLAWASNFLLDDLLRSLTVPETYEFLRDAGLVSEQEGHWLLTAQSDEMKKFARNRIEEQLSMQRKPGSEFGLKVRGLFQRRVDQIFHNDFTTVSSTTRSGEDVRQRLSGRLRSQLGALIDEFPAGVLERIARFQLRMDLPGIELSKTRGLIMVDRAVRLQRVDQMVHELHRSAPNMEIRARLRALFPRAIDLG